MTPPVLLHVFPTFAIGGAQMRFVRIANHFGRKWRHLVVAMNGTTDCLAGLDPNLDVRLLDIPYRLGTTLPNLLPLRRALRKINPDLLVTSNWGAMDWSLANLGTNLPHLHMEDGFNPDEARGQKLRRIWARRLALAGSTVMLPSRTLYDIARHSWHLPEHRLAHIPNGIDCRRFAAAALPAGIPVIGTVAALRPEKNIRRLIDAFALVLAERPARLVIVGEGSERRALEEHVRAWNLTTDVTFAGASPNPETLLPSFSLFALSSDTEQMPLSLLEAMATGRPVVATDVGDVAAMVAPLNRPHIVARTASALAGAMLSVLAEPASAAALGAANAHRARAIYDEQRMFDAHGHLIDGLTGPSTATPN